MKRLGKWLAAHKAIEIVEEGGVRVLQIGGNAIQSAMVGNQTIRRRRPTVSGGNRLAA